jgi:4-deoxy-L-threo-5-hexosulose-uronate ketol-isomerase
MKLQSMADAIRYPTMTTAQLRDTFLIQALHQPGTLQLTCLDLDRAILGIASPLATPLPLPTDDLLRAACFTERRELGALNIGGPGKILIKATANDKPYSLSNLDCLYIGRGNQQISFASDDPANPAVFYLLSYPAHATHPTTLIRGADIKPVELGSADTANRRSIHKYIHLEGALSCQLVMGVTHLAPGSVWNTMPAHTHNRRSEIYLYFNLPDTARVFHLMGPPDETRHLILKDREAVASPGWSIHAGVGTQAYSFCWGMGGENQDYADMDPAPLDTLR